MFLGLVLDRWARLGFVEALDGVVALRAECEQTARLVLDGVIGDSES